MTDSDLRTEIGSLGEFGLIDRITSGFSLKQPSSKVGIGDDAAVIAHGEQLMLVSTDLLLEGIHFDLMYHPIKHLGYKAIVVNLSDIYAMNGTPTQVTVSLGLSNRFSVEAVEDLYAGVRAACQHYGVDLVGGDTTTSQQGLVISITAIGNVDPGRLTLRSTASKGDLLCVTGDLGAAYIGLQILEREKQIYLSQPGVQPDLEDKRYTIGKQLKPEARADMIEIFARSSLVPTAMMDVSDGLSSDLMHICKASGLGAIVEESGIPIHPETEQTAIRFNLDPATCALSGGEDYELLFTVREVDLPKVRVMPDIYILGEMVDAADGVKLHTKGGRIATLTAQGWKHF